MQDTRSKHKDLIQFPMPRKEPSKHELKKTPEDLRKEIAACKSALKKENRQYSNAIIEIPKSEWPAGLDRWDNPPIELHRSRNYFIILYQEKGCRRMAVCRTAIDELGNWKHDLTWEELQDIKRWIGFGNKDAVEVFPDDQDVAGGFFRHLWIFDDRMALAWRNKKPSEA